MACGKGTAVVHSAVKKWLIPILGFAAALTFALPISAQAAPIAKAAPSLPNSCFSPAFELQGAYTNTQAYVPGGTTGNNLIFLGSTPDVFCQYLENSTTKAVTIYDTSAGNQGDCLAYNSTTGNVYLHNSSGCGGSADYLTWKFIYQTTVGGIKRYKLENLWNNAGFCVTAVDPASIAGCTDTSQDQYTVLEFIPA
jgi:hypothetical protein